MTGSISRKLYQQLLSLFPDPFQHEFGDEMLEMFEECHAAQGSWRLLADLSFSAVKQNIYYLSAPDRNKRHLYSEITSGPNLARILAVAVCAAALIPGVLSQRKQKAPESAVVRSEVQYWFPTGMVVIKRRPNGRESWTVIRPASQPTNLLLECKKTRLRQTR